LFILDPAHADVQLAVSWVCKQSPSRGGISQQGWLLERVSHECTVCMTL
jgi:hypothetical protein